LRREIEEREKREGRSQSGERWKLGKQMGPHLSMLDFVSAILLRLATRNP
jgi:hypothetical protein